MIQAHDFIPSCRILVLAIEHFTESELRLDNEGHAQPLSALHVRLGGGNFGGDLCAVKKWKNLFLEQLDWYMLNGAFIGKDQPMYGSICIEHQEMCFIVDGPLVRETKDVWFAMQPVLHGVTVPVPQYKIPLTREHEA